MYRKSNQKCLPCGFDIKAISDIYPNNQMFLCTFSLKARLKILPQPFWQSLQRCFSLTTVWDTFMRYVSYFTQNGKLLLKELLCCPMAFPVLSRTTLELEKPDRVFFSHRPTADAPLAVAMETMGTQTWRTPSSAGRLR